MPHTKFDSNRTDSSGEEYVLVSVAKIGGNPLSPLTKGQWPCGAERIIQTCSRSPHTYFSAFGLVVSDKKIFKENAGFGSHLSPTSFVGADPEVEHNMTRTHCLDASYQI